LLDHNYQKRINGLFFGEHKESYFDFVPKINLMKIRVLFYKIYLSNFINFIKKNYNIKIIFNFAIHYKSEVFYDEISIQNEIKFLTMHRECLYCNSNIPKIMMKKLKKIPSYKGTKIFVHNNIVKNLFIKSNFCKKDQVAVIGPIRTDKILSYQNKKGINKKKTILFYIFGTGCVIDTNLTFGKEISTDPRFGWYNLIKNTYKLIIKIAKEYPEHNFVFKPKFGSKYFIDFHNKMTKKEKLKNIKFVILDKNYALLKRSDLVISFGSTTILETLIINKSLLVPFFDEVKNPKYKKFVPFKELVSTNIGCNNKKIFSNKLKSFLNDKKNFN